jgi:hypothetical protein
MEIPEESRGALFFRFFVCFRCLRRSIRGAGDDLLQARTVFFDLRVGIEVGEGLTEDLLESGI